MSQGPHQAGTHPGSCDIKRPGVFLDAISDYVRWCPSTVRVKCPRSRCEPGLLDRESSAPTLRPPRPHTESNSICFFFFTQYANNVITGIHFNICTQWNLCIIFNYLAKVKYNRSGIRTQDAVGAKSKKGKFIAREVFVRDSQYNLTC